ncbi:ABC transporter ATP-binding protein [Xylophilus ampelinus]|uniref:Amino acid/amide ABC transporter ATP-binding protein 1 (HAAT family) n=1 Tax=Xylophilus ampelinus TaxID=54067 RepID=A0A318SHM1_9BURK|nr:ABC transporter ATP-binding protein [Xylophilus ampelinus]PYE78308.1 amino acid/amide ABC transporter ATP-binding protein 1 (HAAT family) [Xylophilus ampelinus]
MSAELRLDAVSRHFGGLKVLQDVNLTIPQGGIFGLIGPNGAGKTTVFNLITGLLPPTSGNIRFDGEDLVGRKPHQITRLGLGRTFQNIRLFKEMSLLQNVMVGMHAHLRYGAGGLLASSGLFRAEEKRARERARELLSWMKLDHKAEETADNLSYGEQRKLELARALATGPKLLLLDEPVAGMNSSEKTELMREIENISARGYTIFMIEHDMRFVMGLCQEIAVLNFGRIIAQGGPDAIRNDPQVIEAYLGREDDEPEAGGGPHGIVTDGRPSAVAAGTAPTSVPQPGAPA